MRTRRRDFIWGVPSAAKITNIFAVVPFIYLKMCGSWRTGSLESIFYRLQANATPGFEENGM